MQPLLSASNHFHLPPLLSQVHQHLLQPTSLLTYISSEQPINLQTNPQHSTQLTNNPPTKLASNTLTENDRKLLAAAWHCFETQPKINFSKLAEIMGYKSTNSAATSFSGVKKKLLALADAGLGVGEGTPKKKSTPKKKGAGAAEGKRALEVDDDDDDDDDGEVAVAVARKAKKGKKMDAIDEEGDAEVKVKDEFENPIILE
ncbi:hypothetical protein Q7P37_007262 [Cladosporium fusiforme]